MPSLRLKTLIKITRCLETHPLRPNKRVLPAGKHISIFDVQRSLDNYAAIEVTIYWFDSDHFFKNIFPFYELCNLTQQQQK